MCSVVAMEEFMYFNDFFVFMHLKIPQLRLYSKGLFVIRMLYILLVICFQDWSAPGNFKQLNLQWHEPNSDEMQMLDKLLHEFLEPEMNHLKAFVNGKYMDR